MSAWPILLKAPSFIFPPVDLWRGTRPSQAAKVSGVMAPRIIHAHHEGGTDYKPRVRPVLPLALLTAAETRSPPLHHVVPARLLAALSSEYLIAEVAIALMDSLASENAACLRAKDAASRNIEDRLERLRRDEHVALQEEMTADMIDVVTGAETIFNA